MGRVYGRTSAGFARNTRALTGVDADSVVGGMAVVVAFDRPDGSEAIPVFRAAPDR